MIDPRQQLRATRTRRHFLGDCGLGLGALALADLAGAGGPRREEPAGRPRGPHQQSVGGAGHRGASSEGGTAARPGTSPEASHAQSGEPGVRSSHRFTSASDARR